MRLVSGARPDLEAHFEWVGGVLAEMLKNAGMLEPESRLLDIGCGCGRVARHLLDSPIKGYSGFDRHPGMIAWARAHIEARDKRFRFQHVDVVSVYKKVDGQPGVVPAAEFVFPWDDETFTGALAASVFTHMDLAGATRYLGETARVLVPGGRAWASFFLGERTGAIEGSDWNFLVREDDVRTAVQRVGLEVLRFKPPKPPSRHSWFLLERPLRGSEI